MPIAKKTTQTKNFGDSTYYWRIAKRKKQIVTFCSSMIMIIMAALGLPATALSEPVGGVITGGSGSISQRGTNTNINQNTQRLDIRWQDFSTNVNESVNFRQPNTTAVAINRVVGGVPSQLRGALNANGRVFILNNAGIVFHGTSRVNVGALIASTADQITTEGQILHMSGGKGEIINHGNIRVSQGGFAVLAAPQVTNTGTITADLGRIALASTTAMTVDLRGDGLITYKVTKGTAEKLGVTNTGTLQAKSGMIDISTNVASDVIDSVVNLDGVINADALDKIHNGGTVMVASTGNINLNKVNIHADGGTNGKGGTIKTLATKTNIMTKDATLTARGGTENGDGGLVEISGQDVIVQGKADTRATNGKSGMFMIDPSEVYILNGSGVNTTNTFYETWLEGESQSGNSVYLQADNLIHMENLADNELTGGSGDIHLESYGRLEFAHLNDTIRTTTGNITLEAGSDGMSIGHLVTGGSDVVNPGQIWLYNSEGGSIHTGNLTVRGLGFGVIHISPPDSVVTLYCDLPELPNVPGDVTTGNITVDMGNYEGQSSAEASIYGHDITVNGDITLSALAGDESCDVSGEADADAHLLLNATNNILINGDTHVTAHAIGTDPLPEVEINPLTLLETYEFDGDTNAHAYSSAIIEAGHDVTICGDVLVLAQNDAKTCEDGNCGGQDHDHDHHDHDKGHDRDHDHNKDHGKNDHDKGHDKDHGKNDHDKGHDKDHGKNDHDNHHNNTQYGGHGHEDSNTSPGSATARLEIRAGTYIGETEETSGNLTICCGTLGSVAIVNDAPSNQDTQTMRHHSHNTNEAADGVAYAFTSLSAADDINIYSDFPPFATANNAHVEGMESGYDEDGNDEATLVLNARHIALHPRSECPACDVDTPEEPENPYIPPRRDDPDDEIGFNPLDSLPPTADYCDTVNYKQNDDADRTDQARSIAQLDVANPGQINTPEVDAVFRELCEEERITTDQQATDINVTEATDLN